jgi:hypothetical protein
MHQSMIKTSAAVVGAILLGWAFVTAAEAPRVRSPLEGIWQWEYTAPDGGKVTPRLRFRMKEGVLVGNSRFRRGSEAPVTNLTVKEGVVSFDVVRERHDGEEVLTQYRGRLNGDTIKGRVTSKAEGEPQTHEWAARRVSPLEGVWTVSTDIGRDEPLEAKLTLQQDGEKLAGKISAFRRDLDIHKGKFKDGKISFETERRSRSTGEKSITKYHGRMVGDVLKGQVEMNDFRTGDRETNDWEAVRAD